MGNQANWSRCVSHQSNILLRPHRSQRLPSSEHRQRSAQSAQDTARMRRTKLRFCVKHPASFYTQRLLISFIQVDDSVEAGMRSDIDPLSGKLARQGVIFTQAYSRRSGMRQKTHMITT